MERRKNVNADMRANYIVNGCKDVENGEEVPSRAKACLHSQLNINYKVASIFLAATTHDMHKNRENWIRLLARKK